MTEANEAIVVGYDGSAEAGVAVDWATAEASRLTKPLLVVHAATHTQPIARRTGRRGRAGDVEEASGRVADEGVQRARSAAQTEVDVQATTERAGASAALERLSQDASLVAVGNRGRGRITGTLLGSVAFALATHAHSPVVVVRGSTGTLPQPGHPVVVGVDGSRNTALDHAADLAADTGVDLHILVAWEGTSANPWDRKEFANVNTIDETSADARQAATAIAEDAAARATNRRPDLRAAETLVREGRPEQLLTEASSSASLVVVGARGRSDLAHLLLGSISRSVVHGSECPVKIVR